MENDEFANRLICNDESAIYLAGAVNHHNVLYEEERDSRHCCRTRTSEVVNSQVRLAEVLNTKGLLHRDSSHVGSLAGTKVAQGH